MELLGFKMTSSDKGAGAVVTDLIAGHIQLASMASPALPHLHRDACGAIAVRARSAPPQLPTCLRSPIRRAGYVVTLWFGCSAAGTPREMSRG